MASSEMCFHAAARGVMLPCVVLIGVPIVLATQFESGYITQTHFFIIQTAPT